MKRTRRKVLFWLMGIVALLLLLVVAMPLWFPWLLGPLAAKAGLQYRNYAREGYSRFQVQAVSYTNAQIQVTVRQIRLFVPSVWIWHHVRSHKSLTYVEAIDWKATIVPSLTGPRGAETSTYTNAQKIGAILGKVDHWLPNIALTNGSVQLSNRTIKIEQLVWQNGTLRSVLKPAGLPASISVEGRIGPKAPWQLKASYTPLHMQADLQAVESRSNLVLTGRVLLETNRFDLNAQFAPTSSLPRQASITCSSFSIPARLLKLQNYGDVKGAVSIGWNRESFAGELSANAAPMADSKLPPVDVRFRSRGNLHQAQVDQFKVVIPGIQAELANSVSFPMADDAPPAVLNLSANLAQQRWVSLEGMVLGELRLIRGTNSVPVATFSITGTNIGTSQLKAKNISLGGTFDWPSLELRQCRAEFSPESMGEVAGNIDLSANVVRRGELRFDGAPPAGLLPKNYRLEHLALSAEFDGPLANLRHREKIDLRGISSGQLVCSNATITATGQGKNVALNAVVNHGGSALQISLSGNAGGETNDIHLAELALKSGGATLMALQQPCAIRIVHGSASTQKSWQAEISRLSLSGASGELRLEANLQWPGEGRVKGQIRGLALQHFAQFIPARLAAVLVEEAHLEAQWQHGPATFLIVASGSYTQDPGFTLKTQMRGDSEGLNISNLTVASQSAPVISAHGFIPITINPAGGTNVLQWRSGRGLALKAGMQPDPKFWQRVGELTKIQISQPQLSIDVSGPWNSPTGWVHASVQGASFSQTNRAIPSIENLQFDARLDAEQIRVEELRFLVQKQPVVVTAELPLDANFYNAVLQRKLPDWKRGNARLRIGRAPIAAFVRYMPKVLMPLGAFDLDVAVKGGTEFDGHFSLEGATTQPIGELGPIRDINALFRLKQRSVLFERVHATVGGEGLEASGSANLSDLKFGQGMLPPFQVKVSGRNIPLARKPEAIIRSDIDLSVSHSKTNEPVVRGNIILRDSFYTSDLESLIPGRLSKPSERPPYFSVEIEPLASWRLDCRVKGDRFLKLRTPFLRGTMSADFKLEGTLREPLASGEARIASGEVEFPFGTLDMKQGFVSLTAGNPFQPQIYANARARRFGYDITMEVTRSADKPLIQFSSVPSLSSDQIFLLLTAGELPRDEITFTPQQRAQRFAVYLGQRLLAKLGFGGGSERLTIRSGEDISESGRQTYDVEYKLDRDWSIVGQYDRFNAFNLSLKRRIFSR